MTQTLRRLTMPWIAAIMVCGIFLRLKCFGGRDFWTDEVEQLRNLSRPFWELLTGYVRHMPGGFAGDYILTWPLAQVTSNKWLLILPHMVTMLAGYYLLYRICLEEFETRWGP